MDCIHICGAALYLEGAASPARAAVEAMLACLPCQGASPAPVDRRSALTLCIHQLAPDARLDVFVPAWLLTHIKRLPADREVALVYGQGGDCAALAANSQALYCAWLSAETGRLVYLAQKRTENDLTPLSVSSVLVPVLREFFAMQGKALVHAAGLQSPSGHGILLLAESGGGKTTTALSLVRAGARLLADDLVALTRGHSGVCMHGIPEALNLTAQTMRFFPELETACQNLPGQTILPNGKRMLRADAAYQDAYQFEPCRMHALCLIELGGSQPSLQTMEVRQAFGHLLHAHTFARGQRPSGLAMSALHSTLELIPSFRLKTGPDPAALGPWLMEAVADMGPCSQPSDEMIQTR